MLKNKLQILVIGLASIVTALTLGWPRPAAMNKPAIPQKDYQVVASIPVGDNGVHYSNVGVSEMEVTGPESFRVSRDGSFVIADTSSNRILTIGPNGAVQRTVTVPDAVGIADLALTANGDVLALDFGQRVVHRIGQGKPLQKIQLPESFWTNGLSGIDVGKNGEPALALKGGSKYVNSVEEDLPTKSIFDRDATVQVPDLGNEAVDPFTGVITKGQKSTQITVGNLLGGLNIIGDDKAGGFFVSVLELLYGPSIRVDETIWHFDKNLDVVGKARVPLAERFTYVQRGVDVDAEGNVFAMIPRLSRVDIVKLIFKREVPAAFSDSDVPPSPREQLRAHAASLPVQTSCSRTRNQMVSTANSYLNNSTYLTTKNLTGSCSGRTPPRYLGTTAGSKKSIPYNWGGFNTVSEYNSFMTQGFQAGNINSSTCCALSCAKGVDCSGFVSRVWGTSQKYGTSGLTTISTRLSDVRQLQFGDILDYTSATSGSAHVVLFDRLENGGIDDWEATTYSSQDRVVYQYSSWTRLNGYVPYRYNSVCNTGTVSMSVSPTNIWMTRGSTATFTIYVSTNDGYQGSVNLYALNLPGTVLSGTGFFPQTVNVSSNNGWFTSTFKLVTNSTTPTGNYKITIQGYSGSKILTAYIYVGIS